MEDIYSDDNSRSSREKPVAPERGDDRKHDTSR